MWLIEQPTLANRYHFMKLSSYFFDLSSWYARRTLTAYVECSKNSGCLPDARFSETKQPTNVMDDLFPKLSPTAREYFRVRGEGEERLSRAATLTNRWNTYFGSSWDLHHNTTKHSPEPSAVSSSENMKVEFVVFSYGGFWRHLK